MLLNRAGVEKESRGGDDIRSQKAAKHGILLRQIVAQQLFVGSLRKRTRLRAVAGQGVYNRQQTVDDDVSWVF
jgi:hypothetical protein